MNYYTQLPSHTCVDQPHLPCPACIRAALVADSKVPLKELFWKALGLLLLGVLAALLWIQILPVGGK